MEDEMSQQPADWNGDGRIELEAISLELQGLAERILAECGGDFDRALEEMQRVLTTDPDLRDKCAEWMGARLLAQEAGKRN
jgi:hypothetical protein